MTDIKDKKVRANLGDARERLMEVAEKMFAERGFDATSVRDLTAAAECNLAAVNYHFGSKEALYREMFVRRLRQFRESRLASISSVMESKEQATLERLLYSFSRAFLKPFEDVQESEIFMKLYSREVLEQRLNPRLFVEELAEPTLSNMAEALCTICPDVEKSKAMPCIVSLISQLIHMQQVKRMLSGQVDELAKVVTETETMLAHIVRFTAAGIRFYEKGTSNA